MILYKIILSIIFVILILSIIIIFTRRTNNYETYKVENYAIGNTLSSYFTLYFYCCKSKKKFLINTEHKSVIIKHLPKNLPFQFINVEFDIDLLKKYIKTPSLWEENFKVWKSLQPIVEKCIKNSKNLSNIITPKYECVIHFRCADVPFVKHKSYHLLKYSWYSKAINMALLYKNFTKIHIIMCNTHHSNKLSYLCNDLVKDLQSFILKTFNIQSIVICNKPDEDFYIMYNSHILIGCISSFSFFAGLASDNLYILPTFEKENDSCIEPISCRKNMVFIRKEFFKHKDINDYSRVVEYVKSA